MRAALLLELILVLAIVSGEVKGIPQGIKVDEKEKPTFGTDNDFLSIGKGLATLKKIREEFPELIKNVPEESLKIPSSNQNVGFGLGALYNALLGGVHSLYQDLLNRQQAFINLLTCGNCVNEGWTAIMDVALTIPELEWVYNPSEKTPTTFFTAIHQNGSVTGIGGSVSNGKPVAEYVFGNDGIKQHLPKRH